MNFFLTYWSPIVATIALLISIASICMSWRTQHAKASIQLNWVFNAGGQYDVCLTIDNPSNRTIALKSATIIADHSNFHAAQFPVELASRTDGLWFFSDDLPINLSPFSSKKIIIAFQFVNKDLQDKKCCLVSLFHKNDQINVEFSFNDFEISAKEFRIKTEKYLLETELNKNNN